MTIKQITVTLAVLFLAVAHAPAAIRYVDVNSPTPTPPYTNWATGSTSRFHSFAGFLSDFL